MLFPPSLPWLCHKSGDTFLCHLTPLCASGCLGALDADEASERDLLFIGFGRNIQAYDVHNNCDVFHRECQHEVECLVVGKERTHDGPLLFVGSLMSVTGLDIHGKEAYWTVCNDVVSALAFEDVDYDGQLELLTGSRSCDIHVFKEVRSFKMFPGTSMLACSFSATCAGVDPHT